MTDVTARDSNRLAYGGRVLDPAVTAARGRRWGWWYYTEHVVRSMRS